MLKALKIDKADVLGWSLGGRIAQELTLTNPDKVGNLILYATNCVGPSSQLTRLVSNTSIPPQDVGKKLIPLLFPTEWFKANPDYLKYFPIPKESDSPELMGKQFVAAENWKGTCGLLSKIIQPTLIIVGTGDVVDPAPNSLMLAEKIPGSWLVQIRDAGHGLMYQYPNEFNRVLATFLEIYR